MLNEMVLCEELFHTPSGVAFADFITEGHRETWPIRSKRFRTWLRRCYYHASGSAPSAAAIRSALDLLEARAQFDGPERAVNTRVAEHAGGGHRGDWIITEGTEKLGHSQQTFPNLAAALLLPRKRVRAERGGHPVSARFVRSPRAI